VARELVKYNLVLVAVQDVIFTKSTTTQPADDTFLYGNDNVNRHLGTGRDKRFST